MSEEIVVVGPTAQRDEVRSIVARARKLRRNSTDVERKLWHRIRDKQIEEFRFRRQRPIGKYIVDFICLEAKLIVELDGGQHAEDVAYDQKRTAFLESLGYRVLRFWNNDVIENMDGVLQRLHENLLRTRANPTLALPLAGEGTGRANTEVVAGTPSPAQRGKGGMGVRQQNTRNKNAAKDKK
ncbi:MAG: endonuclease domain-containing protein [Betaproteobacteria bacterium]